MRALSVFAVLVLVVPSVLAHDCPPGDAGTLTFTSTLAGSQFGGQGSPTGAGSSIITIDPLTSQATIQLDTSGLGGTITGAGLNRDGQSFLTFTDANHQFSNGMFTRTITLTPAQLSDILANPGAFTIGVNTGEFPQGALRGNLQPGQSFAGTFSGSAVAGGTGPSNGGGTFTADIVPNPSGTGSILNYSFTPTNIGTTITSLGLFQGAPGTAGTSFVPLTNNAVALTNGRLTGSVNLTNAQAQQLMANPNGFFVQAATPANPHGAIRAQFGIVQHELFLPVAGSVRGLFGSQWQTSLQIFNQAMAAPATVTVQMLPTGQVNVASGSLNVANATTFTVESQAISSMPNALQSLFNLGTGFGALRIVSDQPIVVAARIFDASAGDNGATAQQIYALSRCEAFAQGVLIGAANANATNARTNIGFFNPNPTAVTVNLTSANTNGNAGGTLPGATQMITLQPFEQRQMPVTGTNGLFATQFAGGAVTYQASGPIFAYTSVTNNQNSDTHVLMAKEHHGAFGTISEANIAAILFAANTTEVQQGNVAVNRAVAANVRAYGQTMVAEHSAALTQAQSLFTSLAITAAANATSNYLTQAGNDIINQLNAQSGAQFDRAYMQSQVMMHQSLLATIQQVLLPSAHTPQLINLLQIQAAHVQTHLQQAQQILSTLQ